MTDRRTPGVAREIVLWIDDTRAVIVGEGPDGRDIAERLDRRPAETEASFDARTIGEIADDSRILVSGPTAARTGFERAYVLATHRPDRLVDVESTVPAPHHPVAEPVTI